MTKRHLPTAPGDSGDALDPRVSTGAEPSRRRMLKLLGGAILAGGAALAAGGAYALFAEARWLKHERVTIPVPGLPASFEGFRIVQLSDLHIEPFTGSAFIERVVAVVNGLAPELVVLTGDFVSRHAAAAAELTPILSQLRAPHGAFACLGNHDVWAGRRPIVQELDRAGVPVLINERSVIDVAGTPLVVAGIDSAWGGSPNLHRALAGAPEGAPVILLAHEPDLIDGPTADSRVTLQLSGHSHGGQVRVPGLGAPVLPYLGRRYPLGLYRVGESWLYTSRGIGMTGLPLRFNCRPELTEITLTSA